MNVLKDSAELKELWEAMDTVIGEKPVSHKDLVSRKDAAAAFAFDDDIQPILDRIRQREQQRKCAAKMQV